VVHGNQLRPNRKKLSPAGQMKLLIAADQKVLLNVNIIQSNFCPNVWDICETGEATDALQMGMSHAST